ncbi:HAD family hydrolase [Synechococcus sp. KORDI-52]|uniref:HAD family hydrolase n=1 Tax=Synechococcus sp. KORDI-52 TaxID=585425 RepID=UPI0004E032D5|nr:HAD family phosphatase [Synechococcus sp. KORDI-52]AII49653.1 HAD family hydrolase [Synechococcus sp. KORDI-52]
MKLPPAACLFDLDGLLLDTEPLHGRGWWEAAAHFGTQLSENQLMQLKGRRRLDCATQVDAWLEKPVGPNALLEVQQPIVRALLPHASAMPAAQELVAQCHNRGIPMALVTSSSSDAVAFKAAPHPWLEQIQERVYGDDPELEAGKPDPAPFRLAAQRLGLQPKDCWALEDSQAGCQSARRAGCQVWLVSAQGSEHPDFAANPCEINSLGVVLDLLC